MPGDPAALLGDDLACQRVARPCGGEHGACVQGHGERWRRAAAVGLVPASTVMDKYPHELSGGQRQRVGFAQALALRRPELREREGVSCLYITHDVASARYIADRVLVMYAGHLVEEGPTEEVLQNPKHPYTQLLLSAVPDPRAPVSLADTVDIGEPPKVVDPREGCRFQPRCPSRLPSARQCRRDRASSGLAGWSRANVADADDEHGADAIVAS